MHLGETSIRSLPKLGVRHSPKEIANLFGLVLGGRLDLETINLL